MGEYSRECRDCRFFDSSSGLGNMNGACNRFPPELKVEKYRLNENEVDVEYANLVPMVSKDHFCGEFEFK